jgi:hypothetical protein
MFTHHKQALIVALLLMAGCASPARLPTGSPAPDGCELPTDTEEFAAEFVRLRAVQGHFQGGSWNDDVDAWSGRKHRVMLDLGSRLSAAGCKQERLTDLLGSPDRIARPGDAIFDEVSRQAEFEEPPGPDYELLVYYWRGARDYLYFTADGETILGSGWWHAYE